MPITYPPAAPTITGDNITISRFLNNPTLVARRLRTLLDQRYIADALLTGRFTASGGSLQYETGESIFAADNPRAVSPGGEYPLTTVGQGVAALAKTVKWGQDTEVTDESISRQQMDPVNRALLKLANQNVKYVDSVALAAIASAVTATQAATAAWATATAQQMLTDVLQARASILALNQGYDPDTVVVDDVRYARALAAFVAAGFVSRENNGANPALTGTFPVVAGMRWLSSPNLPTANTVLVLDSQQLGGMADENLGGPGYVNAGGVGVQAKTMRVDAEDLWRLRCRRVTVPVVVEPAAGRTITGV
ncbi:MAG: hypothetical protein LC798_10790 [Chloroflexi bacterium]|nr:hypothetical protein [Chloroflexota bacterium]